MTTIWKALPALVIALLGAGLAYLFLEVSRWVPFVVVAAILALGWLAARFGAAKLDQLRPRAALIWLELGALRQAILGAFCVGFGIWAAVKLEPSATASVESKKLLAAIVAAVGAFLTAALLKSAEDIDGNWIAPKIKKLFQDKLSAPLAEHQGQTGYANAEQALKSRLWQKKDWDWKGRRDRAAAIAEVLNQ